MPKPKISYHEHDAPRAAFPDTSPVASAQECTGLMPSPPHTQDQLESYQQLSPMEIPQVKETRGEPKPHKKPLKL